MSDAAVTAAAVPASQGGRRLVLPGQSQTAVLQSARGLQQVPRHHERVQVSDVRQLFNSCLATDCVIPRLHDTAGCQTCCTTGLTTGCIV